MSSGVDRAIEHALEQAGRDAVEKIVDQAADADVPTETKIRHGLPHEEILADVDDADIDLTIVGSKNRSGEYRHLLGSVAECVARLSERPVTIVKTPIDRRDPTRASDVERWRPHN